MEVLGARPICMMSDPEKVSTLDAAMAELARLDALVLQLTAELERIGYAQEIGARDTARFLSERYRIDLPKARRTVRLATALDKHPATAAALPNPATPYADPATAHSTENSTPADEHGGWRVHTDQAEAIFSILGKVPASVPVEDVDFAEQQLIELAATHTPQQLRDAGKPILAILDPDGPEPSEKRAYARESLTRKNADEGVKFQGFLACENAELFRTVIHGGAKPRKTVDGEPDPRPWSKRQADALTTALSNALNAVPDTRANNTRPSDTGPTNTESANAGTANDGAGNVHATDRTESTESTATATDGSDHAAPPTQDALPGVEANKSSMSNLSSAASDPAGATPTAGIVAGHGPKTHISVTIDFNDLKSAASHATGTLMFGDTLSAATVRRLACDAEILPIVLGSKSQPLDVGTSQRLVTQPMRRALNARDKGCVACGAPPTQCEAHHLEHWIDGGITAVSNLVLLCKRDHLDLHSGHWTIQIIDDVVHVTRPTWAHPNPIPPNQFQPPLANRPSTVTTPTTDRSAHRRLSAVEPEAHHPSAKPTSSNSRPATSAPPCPTPDSNPWDADRNTNPPPSPIPAPTAPWPDDLDTSPPPSPLPAPTVPRADDPDTNPRPRPAPAPAIPWADDPPAARAPAPTAPWADDPPAAGAPAPTAPWADDPLPVGRPASAPWAEAGFDPWGEHQGLNHHPDPNPTSATTPPPPTTTQPLGSVA